MTFHGIPNFGAVLQGYALCEYLRKCGFDCEIINYTCSNIVKRELTFKGSKNFLKNFVLKHLIWNRQQLKIAACREFEKSYLSERVYDVNSIGEANGEYDCFISGSDMIWNLAVTDRDFTFYLDFVKNSKYKFSYGSSVGAPLPDYSYQDALRLLKNYNMLSVREKDTAEFLANALKVDCAYVSDPTMLLQSSDWEKMVLPVRHKNYVFVYFGGDGALEAAVKYAKANGKKVLYCNFGLPSLEYKNVSLYSPEEFLSYIANADAVFTDSYHGLLFSFYFKKKVWSFNSSNRILTLLEQLDLEKVYFKNDSNFEHEIDYKTCSAKIEELRKSSAKYLKNAITGSQNYGTM